MKGIEDDLEVVESSADEYRTLKTKSKKENPLEKFGSFKVNVNVYNS